MYSNNDILKCSHKTHTLFRCTFRFSVNGLKRLKHIFLHKTLHSDEDDLIRTYQQVEPWGCKAGVHEYASRFAGGPSSQWSNLCQARGSEAWPLSQHWPRTGAGWPAEQTNKQEALERVTTQGTDGSGTSSGTSYATFPTLADHICKHCAGRGQRFNGHSGISVTSCADTSYVAHTESPTCA